MTSEGYNWKGDCIFNLETSHSPRATTITEHCHSMTGTKSDNLNCSNILSGYCDCSQKHCIGLWRAYRLVSNKLLMGSPQLSSGSGKTYNMRQRSSLSAIGLLALSGLFKAIIFSTCNRLRWTFPFGSRNQAPLTLYPSKKENVGIIQAKVSDIPPLKCNPCKTTY